MILSHVTLNTGHTTEIDLSAVDADTIRRLEIIWPHGGQLPTPLTAYRIEFGGVSAAASFSVWRGREPLVICAVCFAETDAEELWAAIERIYLDAAKHVPEMGTEYPERPKTPWMQVALMPPLLNAVEGDIRLMARIEQGVAAMLWRDIIK